MNGNAEGMVQRVEAAISDMEDAMKRAGESPASLISNRLRAKPRQSTTAPNRSSGPGKINEVNHE